MNRVLLFLCLTALITGCAGPGRPTARTPMSDFIPARHPPQDPVDEMVRARSSHGLRDVVACAEARAKRAQRRLDDHKVHSIAAQIHGNREVYWLVVFAPRENATGAKKNIAYLISDRLTVDPKDLDAVELNFLARQAFASMGLNPDDPE